MDALTVWLLSKWVFSTLSALILIMGIGQVLGEIKLPGNFKLGVAAVFFVGVALCLFEQHLRKQFSVILHIPPFVTKFENGRCFL